MDHKLKFNEKWSHFPIDFHETGHLYATNGVALW